MAEVIITNLVEIVTAIIMMLLGLLGTWLSLKMGKRVELQNINRAQGELIQMAQITVNELQQTIVADMKAASATGKLNAEQIEELGEKLIKQVIQKMSQPTYDLLNAAGVDIVNLITGAGEAWLTELKKGDA